MDILFITQIYPIRKRSKGFDKRLALHYYVREWANTEEVKVIRLHNFPFWYAWIYPFLGYPSSYELDGVQVYNKLVIKWTWHKRNYAMIDRFFKKKSFDLVVAHIPDSLKVAAHLNKRFGVPYIAGIQKTDYRVSGLQETGRVHLFFKNLLDGSIGVGFWSKMLKASFQEAMPELIDKSADMPGGITHEWQMDPQTKNFDCLARGVKIATVGQLVKQKRIEVILEGLSTWDKAFSYSIVGDGPQRKHLEKQVRELSLEQKVNFRGFLDTIEIRDELESIDIMILLSTQETFGLVYLEAMSRGCLAIGTMGEGIDGVIKDGINGFVCESTSDALRETLNRILEMPAADLYEIARNARKTAMDYSYNVLAKEYLWWMKKKMDEG